jgi:two-component system, cell cycle sensor histidine kinase and response regulator CckA
VSIPTLFVVGALVLVALAAIMVFFAALRRIFPGFREWAAAQAAGALGLVLLALRGRAPDLVSVLVANAFLLAHPILASRGFERFYGAPAPRRRRAEVAALTAALALILVYLWPQPDLRARIVVFGVAATALHLSAGLGPLASPEARASRVQWVISAFFCVIALTYFVRAARVGLGPPPAELFADPTLAPQVLAAVPAQVILVCGLLYLGFDRARASLEESEGRLRMALEGARGASWAVDYRTGRHFWSSGNFDVLGLPEDAAPSRELWLSRVHPEDRARMLEAVEAGVREGRAFETEGRLQPPPERWILVRGRPLPGGGAPTERAVGIVLDVTDRKRAEEALRTLERERAYRESAARFQALIEKSTDVIYVIDGQRTIRYFSPGATATLGWRAEEVLGRRGPELIHPDDDKHVAERFRAFVAQPGSTARFSFRFRHRDGSYRLLDAVARDLRADPVLAGVVVNARDVTEQQRLQEQLIEVQRLEGIGQLAGGVAHDFNNLLTAILGGAQGIRESLAGGTPPLDDDLQAVLDAGSRATELTRQLLAFARRQPIAPTPLDPCALLRELELLVRRLLRESIGLSLELAPGTWAVRADAGQLRQVILNLAVNARDAMPGGGRLVLSAENETLDARAAGAVGAPGPGDYVRLSVRDTGTGMTPEARTHLFEPFFTTKTLGRGTGLGLAVVHGIVKQSGGAIAVETAPGRGTSIHVHLPRCDEPVARPPPAAPQAPAGGGEAILLVEDEGVVRAVAERTLRAAGYAVRAAASAEEALAGDGAEAGAGAGIDLLVTDVVMPGMNGRQLSEELRRRHPGLRVLFISGFTHDAVAQHGVIEPGVDLLEKPFLGPTLLARVRSVLDRPAAG